MAEPYARHSCLVYQGSPLEQLPVIASVLVERLRGGYRCLFLGEPANLELAAGALWEHGVTVSEECAKGSLVFSAARDHLDHGGFKPAAMIEGLERLVDQAVGEGYRGLWASGDMAWELGADVPPEVLQDYETRLDELIARKPLAGICQYRRDAMPARLVGEALRTHRSVFLGPELRRENPFYVPPSADEDWSRLQLERVHAAEKQRDLALERLERANADLEQRVKDRTAELEAFTHAVAHDLKAPLRSIEGFSSIIERRHAPALPPEARELFSHVRRGATQMAGLIDALLALSRLSSADLHEEEVDLSTLAERALARLRAAEPARRVETVVQPGLTARGDARLLATVLDNLLGNAWKFTAGAEAARVELSAKESDGRRVFVVSDNGAGFDPTQASRLFQAFQRLHSRSEFPGNGLGLTTVRRIVQRHGGEVWADGAPGKGAAFSFTLGKRPAR